MKEITMMILDKSLIARKDLIDIISNEPRREEFITLLGSHKIALYNSAGKMITYEEFMSLSMQGCMAEDESLAI